MDGRCVIFAVMDDCGNKGWQPRQPHPGTRIIHYRCCLPALAGFANYRRERTNGAAMKLAERAGFEPAKRFDPLTHFPGVLLQPLGHLSAPWNGGAQHTGRDARKQASGLVWHAFLGTIDTSVSAVST